MNSKIFNGSGFIEAKTIPTKVVSKFEIQTTCLSIAWGGIGVFRRKWLYAKIPNMVSSRDGHGVITQPRPFGRVWGTGMSLHDRALSGSLPVVWSIYDPGWPFKSLRWLLSVALLKQRLVSIQARIFIISSFLKHLKSSWTDDSSFMSHIKWVILYWS